MKTRGARKLISELSKTLEEIKNNDLRITRKYTVISRGYLPHPLTLLVDTPNARLPAFDAALCRLNKRSIQSPSRSTSGLVYAEYVVLKMLMNYVKKNNKNGWINWEPLMKYL